MNDIRLAPMKIAITRLAILVVGMIAVTLLVSSTPVRSHNDKTAALYKSKCASCHGAHAQKKFDPSKPEDEMVNIVLKGKKAEKPPNMPGYADKGITEDQAKALVAFMKSKH